MTRPHILSLVGSVGIAGSPFLPWLRIGAVGLRGVPDPAGLFVAAVGALGVVVSLAAMRRRAGLDAWLTLVGLASLTTLVVVWITGPATIADRALARAEALALVDNVAMQPVPPVDIGVGLVLGLLGALLVSAVGIASAWREGK